VCAWDRILGEGRGQSGRQSVSQSVGQPARQSRAAHAIAVAGGWVVWCQSRGSRSYLGDEAEEAAEAPHGLSALWGVRRGCPGVCERGVRVGGWLVGWWCQSMSVINPWIGCPLPNTRNEIDPWGAGAWAQAAHTHARARARQFNYGSSSALCVVPVDRSEQLVDRSIDPRCQHFAPITHVSASKRSGRALLPPARIHGMDTFLLPTSVDRSMGQQLTCPARLSGAATLQAGKGVRTQNPNKSSNKVKVVKRRSPVSSHFARPIFFFFLGFVRCAKQNEF
jgi:hypothetical protein